MKIQNEIINDSNEIYVDDFIFDLIPNFIKNKFNDIDQIKTAIENKNPDIIKNIGHNWKGVCSSYGFNRLAEMGKKLELLAVNENYIEIKQIIDALPNYLKNIQIIRKPPISNQVEIFPEP